MHIEPGVVVGAKLVLGYATAAGSVAMAGKLAWDAIKEDGTLALAGRSAASAALAFGFFQILPHYPMGVSEVHFILGSTLLLMFGAAPAAFGLALGLLAQGLLFAPADLPQYGMNVTTLLVPLFAVHMLAKRIIPARTAYKDVSYAQALKLSTAYQGGIVAWVAFWAFYGGGFSVETLASVGAFGSAYMLVIAIEPIADLAILALVKNLDGARVFQPRLHHGAA